MAARVLCADTHPAHFTRNGLKEVFAGIPALPILPFRPP